LFIDYFTPLHYASLNNCYQNITSLLLSPKIDPNIGDNNGKTALHWAVIRGNYESVFELMKGSQIQINQQQENGMTALHYAASNGFEKIICLLIEYGAQKTIRDNDEFCFIKTILHSILQNDLV